MDNRPDDGVRFTGMVALLLSLSILYNFGSGVMDRFQLASVEQPMRPVCVGRYVIDLPDSMQVTYRGMFLNGFWISNRRESEEDFHVRVARREAEINATRNKLGGVNMETVSPVSDNGFVGKRFVFGRDATHYFEGEQSVDLEGVALEAYVHSQGISFNIIADSYDPEKIHNLHDVIARLRLVAPGALPSAPGVCFGPAMFIDPVPADWTEGVSIRAHFRDHPDLALSFHTRAGLRNTNGDPGRLVRHQRVHACAVGHVQHRCIRACRRNQVGRHHAGAFLPQQPHHRFADPAACAGDQRAAALQPERAAHRSASSTSAVATTRAQQSAACASAASCHGREKSPSASPTMKGCRSSWNASAAVNRQPIWA